MTLEINFGYSGGDSPIYKAIEDRAQAAVNAGLAAAIAQVQAIAGEAQQDYNEVNARIETAQLCRNNLTADRAPLETDDSSQGYAVGSRWLFNGREWVLVSSAIGIAQWVYTWTLTLQHFGAVPGSSDSTAAIQRAIDSKKPIRVEGHFTVTAPLTGEFVQFHAVSPDVGSITWRGAGAHGFVLRPTSYYQRTVLEGVGIHTEKATPADTAVDVSWLHLGTSGLDFFRNRFRMVGCTIIGANNASHLYGWKRGVVLDFPFSCEIENCMIYGKWTGGLKMPSDFTSDIGVYVPDQAVRTLANVSVSKNTRIFGFHTAAKIYNVEGVNFDGNDLQVDYDGLVIENTISPVNQYRIRGNHIGVTGRHIAVKNARQVLMTANEISYRSGRTDGGVVDLIHFDSVYSSSVTGNSIRGNVFNDTDVVVVGFTMTATLAAPQLALTSDVAFAANNFQNLSTGIRGVNAAKVRRIGISPSNTFDGIRSRRINFDGFPANTTQAMIAGTGDPAMIPGDNEVMKIVQNGAACLALAREGSDGGVVSFWRNGVNVGGINTTATSTAYVTTSDARLKDDLGPMADMGPIIDALQLHRFAWKATGDEEDGLFAQEVAEIYPAAAHYDEEKDLWFVDYAAMVPVIMRELQSLRQRLAEIEATA